MCMDFCFSLRVCVYISVSLSARGRTRVCSYNKDIFIKCNYYYYTYGQVAPNVPVLAISAKLSGDDPPQYLDE